jgi:hypothetical protein
MRSAELWAVPRHKALRVKNIVSTIFSLFFLRENPGLAQTKRKNAFVQKGKKGVKEL